MERFFKKFLSKNLWETLKKDKDCWVLIVPREKFLEIAKILKEKGFIHLIDLCGVDYLDYKKKKEHRFEVVYHLFHMERKILLRVKVPLPEEEEPWQYSVINIWKSADWFERECFDMFGIRFIGHPCLKRVYMPDDWKGYPLRKDYPLMPEEETWEPYKKLCEGGKK